MEPGRHELFFFSGQKMMVADVRENGATFTASAPRELFSAPVLIGASSSSDEEPFNKMTEVYPHWVASQPWLMFGFPGA